MCGQCDSEFVEIREAIDTAPKFNSVEEKLPLEKPKESKLNSPPLPSEDIKLAISPSEDLKQAMSQLALHNLALLTQNSSNKPTAVFPGATSSAPAGSEILGKLASPSLSALTALSQPKSKYSCPCSSTVSTIYISLTNSEKHCE